MVILQQDLIFKERGQSHDCAYWLTAYLSVTTYKLRLKKTAIPVLRGSQWLSVLALWSRLPAGTGWVNSVADITTRRSPFDEQQLLRVGGVAGCCWD